MQNEEILAKEVRLM